MIIGIDGNEANVSRRVGISEYAFELLMEFAKSKIENLKFEIYLKAKPMPDFPKASSSLKYNVFGPKKLWTQFALPLNLFLNRPVPDIFFSPTHYSPRFSPSPTIISIMDLSYIFFPETFAKKDLIQLRSWTAYSVRHARKIFTISRSSKNDIINYYKVSGDKVVVTYPGVKESTSKTVTNMDKLKKKYGISDKFILFVGTIQPRKNISRLIEAFAKLKEENLQLVIIGKKGWLYEPILAKPKDLGIEDRVKFLDFVSDEDLEGFYKNALCYCLPSLYEGFGLPVLEAMKSGCPVITSNISSLPEAGGDACLYVDPKSVDDIAEKLGQIISDLKLRKDLIKKGYDQVKKFSWTQTAKQTLDVLQEVANEQSDK